MRRSPALLVLVALLSAVASGCAASGPRAPDADARLATEGYAHVVASNDGTWRVGSRPSDPPPLSRPFELALAIEPADGDRARLAQVAIAIDCTMPQHGHGMEVLPEVVRVSPGRFIARGLELFMEGEWLLTIDIAEGTETERAEWWVEPE